MIIKRKFLKNIYQLHVQSNRVRMRLHGVYNTYRDNAEREHGESVYCTAYYRANTHTHGIPISPTSTTFEAFNAERSRCGSRIRVAMPAYRGTLPPVSGSKLTTSSSSAFCIPLGVLWYALYALRDGFRNKDSFRFIYCTY